jgi:hypothetical protein
VTGPADRDLESDVDDEPTDHRGRVEDGEAPAPVPDQQRGHGGEDDGELG